MDTGQFWRIVDEARSSGCNATAGAVTESLKQREPEDILAFAQHLSDKLAETYRWDLWAVAYIINGGCSDDDFEYFRAWLVSQGRERYEAAKANPAASGEWAEPYEAECEALLGVASDAYNAKTGKDLPDGHVVSKQPPQPIGEEWDEDSVGVLFPELAEMFSAE